MKKFLFFNLLAVALFIITACEPTNPTEMGGVSIPELCNKICNKPFSTSAEKLIIANRFVETSHNTVGRKSFYEYTREKQTLYIELIDDVVTSVFGTQVYDQAEYKNMLDRYKIWTSYAWRYTKTSWHANLEGGDTESSTTRYYHEGKGDDVENQFLRKDFEADISSMDSIYFINEEVIRSSGNDIKNIALSMQYFPKLPSNTRNMPQVGAEEIYEIAYAVQYY